MVDDKGERDESGAELVHQADVERPPLAPDEQALRVARELDRMLSKAESLQEACDRLATRIDFVNTSLSSGFFLATGVAAALLFRYRVWEHLLWIVPALLSMTATLITFRRRLDRRLERDQRALGAIVELLRETEHALVMQGGLSPFEVAQFRIRLSRFDVGPRAPLASVRP